MLITYMTTAPIQDKTMMVAVALVNTKIKPTRLGKINAQIGVLCLTVVVERK